MTFARLSLALLALSMSAACGEREGATVDSDRMELAARSPAAPIPKDANAGPAGSDDLTWIYTPATESGAGRPRLMYSARESDQMGLNLQCSDTEIILTIVRYGPEEIPRTWPFDLKSGDARLTVMGEPEGEPGGDLIVRAREGRGAPLFAAFRQSGELSLFDEGRENFYDAIDDTERAAIAQFFAACA